MEFNEKYVVPEAAPKDHPFMFVVKTANGDIAEFDNEGNETDEYEESYKKLDEYLADDPNNSIITAFFDLIDELDTDLKILKSCGLSVEDIKKEFMEKAKQGIDFSGLEKSDENETEHNDVIEKSDENETEHNNIIEMTNV